MPQNFHVYEAKLHELEQLVGRAVTLWVELEVHVVLMFAWGLRGRITDVTKLSHSINSFALLLDLAERAAKTRLGDRPEREAWNSIVQYVRGLSGDRNHIAHAGIVSHSKEHPDHVDWATVVPKVGPSVSSFFVGTHKRQPMTAADVRRVIEDIQEAIDRTTELHAHLTGERPSSPEKLARPIPIRRTSRAASSQSPPPPPDASPG